MKKLLAILGSVSLTVSTGTIVVACNKEKDNDDVGNVFLDSDGELKIDSEALMRWYQENKGRGDNVQKLQEFFQLFAVGIMKETEKGESSLFAKIEPTTDKNQYALEKFQEKIAKEWGKPGDSNQATVQGAAELAWKKKEEDAKKTDGGKKWKKNLIDNLAKTFPYVKKDFETLKKAWINNEILNNKEDGAYAKLIKLIANYSSRSTSNSKTASTKDVLITNFVSRWKDFNVKQLQLEIVKFIKGLSDEEKKTNHDYLNLLNLINATGGKNDQIARKKTKEVWKLSQVEFITTKDTVSETLVEDLLYRLNTTYEEDRTKDGNDAVAVDREHFSGSTEVAKKWDYVVKGGDALSDNETFFDLVDSYPNPNFDDLKLNGDDNYGFLTNAQKFLVDHYFTAQKPVSISEVVFKKASDGNLEENITGQNFLKPSDGGDEGWNQVYGFYDFLENYVVENKSADEETQKGIVTTIKGTSQYNFDTIFGNDTKDNTGKIRLKGETYKSDPYWDTKFYETKNHEKLLTLSSTKEDYSEITKYSVYDFLQSKDKVKEVYKLNTNEDPNSAANNSVSTLPAKSIPTREKIVENLTEKWGFISRAAAENIATSIHGAPQDAQQKAINGLYATLHLIKDLNRKVTDAKKEYSTSDNQKENKVYQVLNAKQGIIAFVDSDGLHITKINGFDILKKPTETQKTNIFKNNQENYIQQTSAFERLKTYSQNDTSGAYRYIYQDYNNVIGGNEDNGGENQFTKKLINQGILNNVKKYGVSYSDLNPQITNDYERFLVNNSILATNTGSVQENNPTFYKFDFLKIVNDSIATQTDTSTLNENNSWLWDYLIDVLGYKAEEDPNKKLLESLFKFDENSNLSMQMKKWYLEKLKINSRRSKETGNYDFRNGWNAWNDKIEKTKKLTSEENKDLPLMKLAYGELDASGNPRDQSHIKKLREMKEFLPFKFNVNLVFAPTNKNLQEMIAKNLKSGDSNPSLEKKEKRGGTTNA